MHSTFDVALVLLYAVAFMIVEYVRLPATRARMAAAPLGSRVREYATTMACLWVLAGLVFVRLAVGHVPAAAIGLALPHSPLGWGVTALGIGLAWWGTEQQARATRSERGRAAIARSVAQFEWFLPREPREFAAWSALSLTAGVCEEVLFRGHLLSVLDTWMGPWLSTVAGVALFALAHAYQGRQGMVRVAMVGLFMALVYRGSGSLLAPIVAHAMVDYRGGRMIQAALRNAAVAAPATAPVATG